MALQLGESFWSGNGSIGRNRENTYNAQVLGEYASDDTDDPAVIIAFAIPYFACISDFGTTLLSLSWEKKGPANWLVSGHYASPEANRQTNDASWSFNSGSGTQHISTARSLISGPTVANGMSSPPTNIGATINNDGTDIKGMDIDIESLSIKLTFYQSANSLSSNYLDTLERSCKKVNSGNVTLNIDGITRTYQPGELRLLDWSGSKRVGYGDFELSLDLSVCRNWIGVQVGPWSITKNGWDYLDINYQNAVGGNALARTPWYYRVLRVYDYVDLNPCFPPVAFGLSNNQPWLNAAQTSGGGLNP